MFQSFFRIMESNFNLSFPQKQLALIPCWKLTTNQLENVTRKNKKFGGKISKVLHK
jgi:hypothetical protein